MKKKTLAQVTDFDLRLLRVFKTVSECGSFSAAESLLGITCSAISLHMSDLEKRLGMRLCQRGRAGFALTEEGREILRHSETMMAAVSAAAVETRKNETLRMLAKEIRPYAKAATPDSVVGTSKTMRSLARIAGAAPSGEGPYVLRTLHVDDVRETIAKVAPMTAAERATLAGVSAARARQILAGGIVAEAAMDLLGVTELTICPWALREGVILERLDELSILG